MERGIRWYTREKHGSHLEETVSLICLLLSREKGGIDVGLEGNFRDCDRQEHDYVSRPLFIA